MMTSKEIVRCTLEYARPERVARSFGESDFCGVECTAQTFATAWAEIGDGRWERLDEWGNTWGRIDPTSKGEVIRGVLEDLADIESYDPDGNYYCDVYANDNCDYDSDGNGSRDANWATSWQAAHPGEWYDCSSAHSQPLNANSKAYAAWWLWARLGGWAGP